MQTIGVFFGSRSPEHDVSIITGQFVIAELKKMGCSVIPVYIGKDGKWYIGESLGALKVFTQHKLHEQKGVEDYFLDLERSQGKMVFKQKGLMGKEVVIDLAFPCFHGMNGEDGTFQGLCEMLNMPYVGCDVTSSAIAMDKVLTKELYVAKGFPTTKFVSFISNDWHTDKANVIITVEKELSYPVIVKPARLGSSIGIAKAENKKELEMALEVAFHYDAKVIVEQYVDNLMDITVGVIGTDQPVASSIQESAYEKDIFSYEDKYINEGGAQTGNAMKNIIIPARIDEKQTKEIIEMALAIYKAFGCSGIARVDFLYNKKTKEYFANELNTLPGTLYHHLWKASGFEFHDVLNKLIQWAEERHEAKQKITFTFESQILDKANSAKLQIKGGETDTI